MTILSFGLYMVGISPVSANTDVFTTSGTWTAPAGVTSIQVSAWAAGGASDITSHGSGGGGAYSGLNAFSVTPGNTYAVSVGQGGTTISVNGGDSMFSASSTLLSKGGSGTVTTTGGQGGQSASGVGDVVHTGGNGANNSTGQGGGGGGAGTLTNGSNGISCASTCAGGSGGSVGGGNGGNGGGTGSIFGGGGGAIGNGARGEVDITYTPTVTPSTGQSAIKITNGSINIINGQIVIPPQ